MKNKLPTKLIKTVNTLFTTFVCVLLLNIPSHAVETTTYYHHDGLGSAVAASDADGNLLWREDYQPYGSRVRNPSNAGDNTLWFTEKPEEPALGLQYFGARWYDPALGRFTGIDPVGFKESNIHSFNRYAYANNNPHKYIDPDGRFGTAWNVQKNESLNASVQRNSPGNAAVITGGTSVVAVILTYLGLRSGSAAIGACTGPCSAAAIAYSVSAQANDLPSVNGRNKVDYSSVKNPANVGPGKDFTPRQKREFLEINKKANGGIVKSDLDGTVLTKPQKSKRGVTPDSKEWQFDHKKAKNCDGTNCSSNVQILSRKQNRDKSDN